jgi:hypothetical protein
VSAAAGGRLVGAALFAGALTCSVAARAGAQSYTLGDLFASVRSGAATVQLERTRPASAQRLAALDAYFTSIHATTLSLAQVQQLYNPGPKNVGIVARWNRHAVEPVAEPGFADSLTALNRVIHTELEPALQTRLSEDSLNALFKPVDALGTLVLRAAQGNNQEKLRRFAVKYGPGSPQLNLVEVGLNYLVQLKVPGFAPSPDGWTSPYEIVATYRTTDLTASKTATDSTLRGRVVTTGQLGIRKYNFDPNCGRGHRLSELINPCQASFGAFMMGPTDSPLLSPLQIADRGGVYLSRGKYHIAAVFFGSGRRFVFGVDQQIIPYLF